MAEKPALMACYQSFARALRALRLHSGSSTQFHESISQASCAVRTRAQGRHPGMGYGLRRAMMPSASETPVDDGSASSALGGAAVDDGGASGASGMDCESTD
ncbi:MAG: hypothetical protein ALECFALPRED_003716 [Alectoria fallacina]|uniref:Uncharacterized protein n=1 Tax=Alectoria fallacina TaxID=1903189 RepID=A0A8H3FMS1_9LECA|nr:MAG: hypothetical protein ALECFALPRED_003716 [Alectoria fallacina]